MPAVPLRMRHRSAAILPLFLLACTVSYALAFWLRFRADLDRIEARAAASGLRFASSRSFMTREDAERGLRIGFASLNEGETREALQALKQAAG